MNARTLKVSEWHTRYGGCYVNSTFHPGKHWARIRIADWQGEGTYEVELLGHCVELNGSQRIVGEP